MRILNLSLLVASINLVSVNANAADREPTDAETLDDVQLALTRDGAEFDFSITCDQQGSGGTIEPGWRLDTRFLSPYRFNPRCMMMGDESSATYLCKCEDNDASIVGEFDVSSLFPEDEGAPDPEQPGADLFDALSAGCESVFNEHCGPFPEDLMVDCENEHGVCGVLAEVHNADGNYESILTGCDCASGAGWESGDGAKEIFSLSKETAEEVCTAELKHCHPDAQPGPSDVELLKPELLEVRGVTCMNDPAKSAGSEGDEKFCFVEGDNTGLHYMCSDGELLKEGRLSVDGWLSRQHMYRRCREVLAEVLPDEPDTPDDDDDDAGDIGDILDKLGCSVSPSAPYSPILFSGVVLGLFGIVRKRQD